MGRGVGKLERGPRLFVHACCMHAFTLPAVRVPAWPHTTSGESSAGGWRLQALCKTQTCRLLASWGHGVGVGLRSLHGLNCCPFLLLFLSQLAGLVPCLVSLALAAVLLTLASFLLGLTGRPTPVVK